METRLQRASPQDAKLMFNNLKLYAYEEKSKTFRFHLYPLPKHRGATESQRGSPLSFGNPQSRVHHQGHHPRSQSHPSRPSTLPS